MNNLFKYGIIFIILGVISLAGCSNGNKFDGYSEVELEFDEFGAECNYDYYDGYYFNSRSISTSLFTFSGGTVEISDITFQVKINGSTPAAKNELYGRWKKTSSGILKISDAEEDGDDAWWLNGSYSKF